MRGCIVGSQREQNKKLKKMITFNFLENNPNINITVNAEELLEIVDYAISKTRSEFESKPISEEYLTRKATAEKLDVDLSTLWRYDRTGYLCAVKVGGKRRYKLSEVNKILKMEGN